MGEFYSLSLVRVGEDNGTLSFSDGYGRVETTSRGGSIIHTAKSVCRFIGCLWTPLARGDAWETQYNCRLGFPGELAYR